MNDLNEWRKEIDEHYKLLKSQLRNIQSNKTYLSIQDEINRLNSIELHEESYLLNELLEELYCLSDIYNQFQWLHKERLEWLKEYTNSNSIRDSEFYRNMAYNAIHKNILVPGLMTIKMHNSLKELSLNN